jgi:hypothetical protein
MDLHGLRMNFTNANIVYIQSYVQIVIVIFFMFLTVP